MNQKELTRLGVPPGAPTRYAIDFITRYILKGLDKTRIAEAVEAVVRDPAAFTRDPLRGEFARTLLASPRVIREAVAPWKQWGEGLDPEAVYKYIHQVMAAQTDLVEVLGRFDPKLVKMAPSGERPED